MHIIRHQGIIKAEKVISLLRKRTLPAFHAYQGTYLNGRENGYTLSVYNKTSECVCTFWIAEARNSDSIIIVSQEGATAYNELYSDASYQQANYFRSPEEAARYLESVLKNI